MQLWWLRKTQRKNNRHNKNFYWSKYSTSVGFTSCHSWKRDLYRPPPLVWNELPFLRKQRFKKAKNIER